MATPNDIDLLRFITCGSVDDGKSTLIGRLLYDSKMIYEDQLAKIEKDSVAHGTTGGSFDPALLTDGLKEERVIEQQKEIDALNLEMAPFKIFKGIESDILPDGRLDYNDEVLAHDMISYLENKSYT